MIQRVVLCSCESIFYKNQGLGKELWYLDEDPLFGLFQDAKWCLSEGLTNDVKRCKRYFKLLSNLSLIITIESRLWMAKKWHLIQDTSSTINSKEDVSEFLLSLRKKSSSLISNTNAMVRDKGGSRHKVHHYEERVFFFLRHFSNWSTLHRNALASWARSALAWFYIFEKHSLFTSLQRPIV